MKGRLHTCVVSITLLLIAQIALAQKQTPRGLNKNWHGFNVKDMPSIFRHELGISFFTHYYRSPDLAVHYEVTDGIAYPEPVYNKGTGIMSIHYEPRFRLLEYRHWASFSLDFPFVAALTIMDLQTEDGFRFSVDSVSNAAFNAGIFNAERGNDLGVIHAEAGAMLSLNLGQGSTFENASALGLSLGLGAQRMLSPLIMNFIAGFERDAYREYTSWWTPVSRLSLHFRGVLISYTMGVNPTLVYYESLNRKRAVYTNTYNRFSISLRIGR